MAFADVIIVDVCPGGIPRLDRLAVARKRAPNARIVAVTNYPSLELAISAIKGGATSCVASAFELAELTQVTDARIEGGEPPSHLAPLERMEWHYIMRVLSSVEGNISAAARILGIQRSTLQRKLKRRPVRIARKRRPAVSFGPRVAALNQVREKSTKHADLEE